jgi:hypothetical protein
MLLDELPGLVYGELVSEGGDLNFPITQLARVEFLVRITTHCVKHKLLGLLRSKGEEAFDGADKPITGTVSKPKVRLLFFYELIYPD